MNPRTVTFSAIILRLSTPGFLRFAQSFSFDACFGGVEANVAASLAQFGLEAAFVSRAHTHEIGDAAVAALRARSVDTRSILRGGDRLGIYSLESGASQRASKAIYDRAYSAVCQGSTAW